MEFYDKLVERFQDLSKGLSKAKVEQLLRAFKRKYFGEDDAVSLIILYLKVLHDMVTQNCSISFSEAAVMS